MLAFMMWLLGLWTWFKAFISLAWFRAPPLDPASAATSVGLEGLSPEEGHEESALATFLSSVPDCEQFTCEYVKDGFKIEAWVPGAGGDGEDRRFSGDEAAYREFLAAVASSKVEYCKEYLIVKLSGEDASKHLEEIVGALKSNDTIREVRLENKDCSLLRVSECFANLLLQNNVIQHLIIYGGESIRRDQAMGTEAAEQFAKALQENRSLKTLHLWGLGRLDAEGMRVLVEPLKSPHSVLQYLGVWVTSDVGLEHVGVMLATNTSLRKVDLSDWDRSDEVHRRGYTSLRDALAINRTLEELQCRTQSSMELELLLDPLMPTHNRPQSNSTLTSLSLFGSRIGGKEGMDILVGMIRSNSSLLELDLSFLWELSEDPDAVENVLAILAALKTNQSLKEVRFYGCDGVGGYKVLGTMMDLLLENLHLTDIGLLITPLERSGDAEYVYSELKKREKMKLWKLVQGMANEDPKSGRVFLCGNPFAGK